VCIQPPLTVQPLRSVISALSPTDSTFPSTSIFSLVSLGRRVSKAYCGQYRLLLVEATCPA
jgi:hypothetical protein